MLHRLHSCSRLLVLCFTVVSLIALTGLPPHSRAQAASDANAAPVARSAVSSSTAARVRAAYGNLPMRFERNQGQFDSRVRFVARGAGYNLWLTASEAVLSLQRDKARAALIRMKLVNAG